VAALAPAYLPRRPTETVLYALVRQNLETFLAHAREHYDGGLRVIAVITERDAVRRILSHLGQPTEAPPLARARDPTDQEDEFEAESQLGLGLA